MLLGSETLSFSIKSLPGEHHLAKRLQSSNTEYSSIAQNMQDEFRRQATDENGSPL
uniref:Uncharacterized protein n=1 Tax=Anopheles atroparvus TaxID=41427 RepID=A0AAG5CXR6_ANOAO